MKIGEFIDSIKVNLLMIKYISKMKKFNITKDLMASILSESRIRDFEVVLKLISKCDSKEEFKNGIIDLNKDNRGYAPKIMLFGTLFGRYDVFDFNPIDTRNYNLDNLKVNNISKAIEILRENFITYVNNNNKIKNVFLTTEDGINDYKLDLNEEKLLEIFDSVVKGKTANIKENKIKIVKEYIMNSIGIYGVENIENNIDFVLYDFNHNKDLSLEERKVNFYKLKDLNDNQKVKVNNISKLKEKIKSISLSGAVELYNRLNSISEENAVENIEELEDIYLEYELLFRREIVDKLYEPKMDTSIIEDFRELRPQLIHCFIRNPEKFKASIEKEIIDDIIANREDGNKSLELTDIEQKNLERRLMSADTLVDPTQVNYSFSIKNSRYTDSMGLNSYYSDTSNQISASIYSPKYFLNKMGVGMIGIGFNKEGLVPEAIAISSPCYLTTNRGLNNLEYDDNYAFNFESSTYGELIKNDGKSEIVMYRRNIDYDTKASYVFAAIDSSDKESAKILYKAKEYASKNHMKLVIYDLYKISKSYEEYLKTEEKDYFEELKKYR